MTALNRRREKTASFGGGGIKMRAAISTFGLRAGEIRGPKTECRTQSEIRNAKTTIRHRSMVALDLNRELFGFRNSALVRVLAFGVRLLALARERLPQMLGGLVVLEYHGCLAVALHSHLLHQDLGRLAG